jgi:hypothetical protein
MENKLKYISLLLGLALCLAACKTDTVLPPNEYAAFIKNPENGYLKSVQKGKIKMDCLYKPMDYEALSYARDTRLNTTSFNAIKKDIDGNRYYELLMYLDKDTRTLMQTYINYNLEKDLKLVFAAGDTLRPNSYLAEPYDGVSPFQRILFSFPEKKDNNDFTILIDSTSTQSMIKTSFVYTASTINTAKVELID